MEHEKLFSEKKIMHLNNKITPKKELTDIPDYSGNHNNNSIHPAQSTKVVKPAVKRNSINNEFFSNKIINNPEKKEEEKFSIDILKKEFPNEFPESQKSEKGFNIVKSFGLNSYVGYKKSNEDRVIAVEHVKKPANSNIRNWPKISYFGIFDGHGGMGCATFLQENLLKFILEEKAFSSMDYPVAIKNAIDKAEKEFYKKNEGKKREEWDTSGSCANIVLIVDKKIYVANVGDSRTIMSVEGGKKIKPLSIDHKPNNPKEYERIIKCGGGVFAEGENDIGKDPKSLPFITNIKDFDNYCNNKDIVFREYPSLMACVRSIGDYSIKYKSTDDEKGNNTINSQQMKHSIISEPEIMSLDYYPFNDFIIMGCDGIFDVLTNNQIVNAAYFCLKKLGKEKGYNLTNLSGDVCDYIIKLAMVKESEDNLSCIFIAFDGIDKFLREEGAREKVKNMGNSDKKKGK